MGYVLSFEAVEKLSKELGKNNNIVFTHGAYDLFHAGHLDFIKKSKELGQILIVGVDTDKNIALYKNVTRPVIGLKDRLEIISKLDYVDFAFPMQVLSRTNINTPHQYYLHLYKLLKPSLVTYGRKYAGKETIKQAKVSLKDVKFRRVLDRFGGSYSTTKVIDKILASKS